MSGHQFFALIATIYVAPHLPARVGASIGVISSLTGLAISIAEKTF